MKTANVYQILSEDHIIEALTQYLREPPFKLDFDELEIVTVHDVENIYGLDELKIELRLIRGSDES